MKDWFESLDSREQTFVLAGTAVVVVALIYALLWLPLDNSRPTASSRRRPFGRRSPSCDRFVRSPPRHRPAAVPS